MHDRQTGGVRFGGMIQLKRTGEFEWEGCID